MDLPDILLIDDNKIRVPQFELVLNFLEYDLTVVGSEDCQAESFDLSDFDGIFVGASSEKLAVILRTVTEKQLQIPTYLLTEKDPQPLTSAIQQMVTGVLEWPTVYPRLMEILGSLQKQPGRSAPLPSNKGLAGRSAEIGRASCRERV